MKCWIINIHTRACFGPYDTRDEAREDIDNDPHPGDWVLVEPVRERKKKQ